MKSHQHSRVSYEDLIENLCEDDPTDDGTNWNSLLDDDHDLEKEEQEL
jgi:hypothetical protein